MMRLCIFLVISLFSGLSLQAQARPRIERNTLLMKQLGITEKQKEQIRQLVLEEKLQHYWRNKRLQQILTPEQLKKMAPV
jgi:hypothetical protein